MNIQQDIEDIFSALHDGTIETSSGNKNSLTLKISCLYLAEQIDKTFEYFYVELIKINKLELFTWRSLMEEDQNIFTELVDIFKSELEIISADKKDNDVEIFCNINDDTSQYCGGNLTLNCNEIKVYDQNRTKMTIEEFGENCKRYWEKFETK